VADFDPDLLVDANEAAAILGLRQRTSVSVYRNRYPDFPRPVIEKGKCVLWLRADIEAWLGSRRSS
jgi:predicted DNA-binding transcriptional regulator AlpA